MSPLHHADRVTSPGTSWRGHQMPSFLRSPSQASSKRCLGRTSGSTGPSPFSLALGFSLSTLSFAFWNVPQLWSWAWGAALRRVIWREAEPAPLQPPPPTVFLFECTVERGPWAMGPFREAQEMSARNNVPGLYSHHSHIPAGCPAP